MATGSEPGTDRTFREVYEELEEEHAGLVSLVDRIGNHRGLVGLAPLIDELHGLLIRHFSREQFPGGLYERMGAYGSRYHRELEVLVREHCTILSSVRGILERTRTPDMDEEEALLQEVQDVLTRLAEHEHREHELAEKLLKAGK